MASSLSQELYRFVRLGDLENAQKTKARMNEYEIIMLHGFNDMRNGKILLIEFSYTLSQNIIESSSTMQELIKLSDEMLKEYTISVKKHSLVNIHIAVKKALKIINEQLGEPLTVLYLAECLNLNANYFSSLFKSNMGMTFKNYLSKLRIQESNRLLKYTDHKLLDIALHLEFKSQSHFSTVFKKYNGITPNFYRHSN